MTVNAVLVPHEMTGLIKSASDRTWQTAVDKAREEIGILPATPKTTTKAQKAQRAQEENLRRAKYGQLPPPFDPNWLFTPHPYIEIRRGLITRETAPKLLDVMVANRYPIPKEIAKFARLMLQGRFPFTHQGWAMDWDGHFMDGLNRAAALILSGVDALDVLMVVGMPPDHFKYTDDGTNRTQRQTMEVDRELHAQYLSTAVTTVMQYETWQTKVHLNSRRYRAANNELKDCKDRYGDPIREGVLIGKRLYYRTGVSVGATAAAYYLIREKAKAPKAVADLFFEGLIHGASLTPDNPICVTRNHFIVAKNKKMTQRGTGRRYPMYHQMAMILRAWSLWARGETREYIGFSGTEDFPYPPEPWKGKTRWMTSVSS